MIRVYRIEALLDNSFDKTLKELINYVLSESDVEKIIGSTGAKVASLVPIPGVSGAIGIGSSIAAKVASIGLTASKMSPVSAGVSTILPTPQSIIIYIITAYIEPNIRVSVQLFYQLLKVFLAMILFMETYSKNK